MSLWYEGPLAAFDTETSGGGAERAWIVPAAPAVAPAESEPAEAIAWLVDLDNHLERYGKGWRTLTELCEHYGIRLDGTHDAAADATASLPCYAPSAAATPPLGPPAPPNSTPARRSHAAQCDPAWPLRHDPGPRRP